MKVFVSGSLPPLARRALPPPTDPQIGRSHTYEEYAAYFIGGTGVMGVLLKGKYYYKEEIATALPTDMRLRATPPLTWDVAKSSLF